MASLIYKIVTRAEWEAAKATGVYRGSEHDRRDGFIHFSTAAQLEETARKYFTGVPDLILLAVDVAVLLERITPHPASLLPGERPLRREGQDEQGIPLRWEPSRGGELFPHLYGRLPVTAVSCAVAIPLGPDALPIIPDGLL